ncbi:hypothetical protein [Myxococcus xanthus]|uniref:hypothetical protein n=1 Tax=Myxococcus xanthus TaxID=34 RepID=UPI001F15F4F3|nr:hypothetical protein [Myxococcus xanthus]
MPEMTAVLANTLAPWFAKPTRGTSVETLAPGKELLDEHGFAKRDVRSKACWADGKRGL